MRTYKKSGSRVRLKNLRLNYLKSLISTVYMDIFQRKLNYELTVVNIHSVLAHRDSEILRVARVKFSPIPFKRRNHSFLRIKNHPTNTIVSLILQENRHSFSFSPGPARVVGKRRGGLNLNTIRVPGSCSKDGPHKAFRYPVRRRYVPPKREILGIAFSRDLHCSPIFESGQNLVVCTWAGPAVCSRRHIHGKLRISRHHRWRGLHNNWCWRVNRDRRQSCRYHNSLYYDLWCWRSSRSTGGAKQNDDHERKNDELFQVFLPFLLCKRT